MAINLKRILKKKANLSSILSVWKPLPYGCDTPAFCISLRCQSRRLQHLSSHTLRIRTIPLLTSFHSASWRRLLLQRRRLHPFPEIRSILSLLVLFLPYILTLNTRLLGSWLIHIVLRIRVRIGLVLIELGFSKSLCFEFSCFCWDGR